MLAYRDGGSFEAELVRVEVGVGDVDGVGIVVGVVDGGRGHLPVLELGGEVAGLMGVGLGERVERSLLGLLKGEGKVGWGGFWLVGEEVRARGVGVGGLGEEEKGVGEGFVEPMRRRGELLVGCGDVEMAGPDGSGMQIQWLPSVRPAGVAGRGDWRVRLDAVMLDGKKIFEHQTACFDSGASFVHTSHANLVQLCSSIGHGAKLVGKPPKVVFPLDRVKSLGFFIGDHKVMLDVEDLYIGKVVDGFAVMSIMQGCARAEENSEDWTLGGVFLDKVITIFDVKGCRLGISRGSGAVCTSEHVSY